MRNRIPLIVFATVLAIGLPCQGWASDVVERITEMISAYSQGTKGLNDPVFQEKVNELDNSLRESLEKDLDIRPFQVLLDSAQQLKARKSARAMFEVALARAQKRLLFAKNQQEIKDPDLLKTIDKVNLSIERYLDPSQPDDDTVDAKALKARRKALLKKFEQERAKRAKVGVEQRTTIEVTDTKGQPGKLSPAREKNLLAKIKTVVTDPGEMKIQISLKPNDQFDMHVMVKDFKGPNGFGVLEGEMDFVSVPLASLDNSNPSEVSEVLGDTYFKRYRIVQNDDQLNISPNDRNTDYEMSSFMPGQVYKMEFKRTDGISAILKELEGNTQFQVLNAKKAVADKAIEIKNVDAKNLIFMQGTDATGLVSVKGIGTLKPKDGIVSFQEVLLVVDDQLATDLSKFVGVQGINLVLKAGSENTRRGLPFTPVLQELAFDRTPDGKQIYIFTGRGKYNL